MIMILGLNVICAQNIDNSTITHDLGISSGQYEIDISQEKYSIQNDEIENFDKTNGSVERIYGSSANEQNSLNNPHENINLYYFLKLLLFRIAKNISYMAFF